MLYYLIRSQISGKYVVAYPDTEMEGYLLVFPQDFEALSYVNAHAANLAHQCQVEAIAPHQVRLLLERWGYVGIGMVKDALLPSIDFVKVN